MLKGIEEDQIQPLFLSAGAAFIRLLIKWRVLHPIIGDAGLTRSPGKVAYKWTLLIYVPLETQDRRKKINALFYSKEKINEERNGVS